MNTKYIYNISICVMVFFLLIGCTSERGNKSSLIQINLTVSYPEKEIKLEDVAEIEYLQLEVTEGFLFNQAPQIVTADKIIISQNILGDVLIFSRNGKPVSKFNRKGNGPGEYVYIRTLLFDEISDEIFIESDDKIMVYSSSGTFKRMIHLAGRTNNICSQFVNYDPETLLLYDDCNLHPSPFVFISKKDGSVVDSIKVPKGKEVDLVASSQDGSFVRFSTINRIVKHNDGYLLTDFSIDTVYLLSHHRKLSPVLVRKPKIQSMDPVVYLNSFMEAGNYEFVSAVTVKDENGKLPKKYLMRDKKTGSVYRQKITFNDYKGKEVNLSPETIANTQDSKLGLIVLSLTELQDANKENRISGRLKELVEKSDEDGNNIFMLLHFK